MVAGEQTIAVGRPVTGRWRPAVLVPYLFLAPFLLLFVAFLIAPLVYALYLSLFRETLVGGLRFAGYANYLRAFQDGAFWNGLWNMLLFGIMQVPVMLGLALLFALILDSGAVRGKSLFRLGFFIPYAVPSIIAALLWSYLYGPAFGPIAQLARAVGLPPPDFLSDRWTIPSLANVVTWEYTGYNMIILYAALKAVPPDLEEASLIDGASARQYAWYVKIPLIWPAISLTIVFSIIGTLQLFNEPILLRAAAPHVINTEYTPNIYAYFLAFSRQEYNYSAAISFVLGGVVAVLAYAFTFFASRRKVR